MSLKIPKILVNTFVYGLVLQRTLFTTTVMANQETVSKTSATNYTYESGKVSAAFITVPDKEIAKTLARSIVEKRLAACVNIIPGATSIYFWEDKINEDEEVLMMVKTETKLIPELTEFIKKNHPYSTPEVISTKIEDGNPDYLKWVSSTVNKE